MLPFKKEHVLTPGENIAQKSQVPMAGVEAGDARTFYSVPTLNESRGTFPKPEPEPKPEAEAGAGAVRNSSVPYFCLV